MSYGPQAIFAEGRGIAIAKEAGSGQNQSCKGKRGESRKEKRQSVCECCGITYEPDLKAKGRFCSYDCFFKDKKSDMERLKPCLSCHSLLGMTGAASGRMLNLSKFQICKYRKRMGLRTLTRVEAKAMAKIRHKTKKQKALPWWGDNKNAAAWMSEYKPKFFDWSQIWNKEHARRNFKIVGSYYKMTQEEKRDFNKKLWDIRKAKFQNDPEYKQARQQYARKWVAENRDKRNQYSRRAIKKRKGIDPGFKVQCNLRNRLKEIMGKVKVGGTEHRNNLTGCSTKQLATHLESGFKRGMTWDNYGTRWHVDHILPCASFDHTDEKQRSQCWHWTNLRALDAKKNMDKGDSITEPQMSLLLCATQ